jgi:hypothetical protein
MNPLPLPKKMPTAEEAFRHFWRWWIGMVAFPPAMFLATEFFEIPRPLFIALLFIAIISAVTPYLQKRAPFGYWGLVCAAWMGTAFVGVLLLMIARLVMGVPLYGRAESSRREVLTPAPHTTGHTDL